MRKMAGFRHYGAPQIKPWSPPPIKPRPSFEFSATNISYEIYFVRVYPLFLV